MEQSIHRIVYQAPQQQQDNDDHDFVMQQSEHPMACRKSWHPLELELRGSEEH